MQNRDEANGKIRAYLGFSLKSRKICLGVDEIIGLKKGVHLLIADDTIGETAKKRLISCKEKFGCPLYLCCGKIGEFLAKPAVKAAALRDKNLASALINVIQTSEEWKLYSGGEI